VSSPVPDATPGAALSQRLPYNTEPAPRGATLRSFRGVVGTGTAHCLEAALAAAVILEQHGYPPLLLSFESIDELDHVLFVYRARGRWGSIGRSRDPGLHGRKPVFRTPRDLALSYVEPYIDYSGRITGYTVVNIADCSATTTGGSRRTTCGRRACPAGRAASRHPLVGQTDRRAAPEVCRLPEGARRQEAALLQGPQQMVRATSGALVISNQSRSKSRVGLVIGSSRAWRRASSKRRESASPRFFSSATDFWNSASRRRGLLGHDSLCVVELRAIG
jgi:hypothetical protein